MDRKTIIDGLRMTMDLYVFDPSTGEEKDPDDLNNLDRATYDACKGALDILERLDTDPDTISRQAATDICTSAIDLWSGQLGEGALVAVRDKIADLPPAQPAQPERIKGRWIESNGLNILMKKFIEKGETWRVCDKCGAGFMIGYQYECDKLYHETFHNFCPNCGADMKGEDNETD